MDSTGNMRMPVNRARPAFWPSRARHGLLDLRGRVLNALLEQRDPPEIDVIDVIEPPGPGRLP